MLSSLLALPNPEVWQLTTDDALLSRSGPSIESDERTSFKCSRSLSYNVIGAYIVRLLGSRTSVPDISPLFMMRLEMWNVLTATHLKYERREAITGDE